MLNSSTAEINRAISPSEGTVLFVFIGNSMRSDDGIGPYIFTQLKDAHLNCEIIDVSVNIESYIDTIASIKPSKIVFVDAADFSGTPGEIRIMQDFESSALSMSTHTFPLDWFAKIIKQDTNAEIMYIGIQLRYCNVGSDISEEVLRSGNILSEKIKEVFTDA